MSVDISVPDAFTDFLFCFRRALFFRAVFVSFVASLTILSPSM